MQLQVVLNSRGLSCNQHPYVEVKDDNLHTYCRCFLLDPFLLTRCHDRFWFRQTVVLMILKTRRWFKVLYSTSPPVQFFRNLEVVYHRIRIHPAVVFSKKGIQQYLFQLPKVPKVPKTGLHWPHPRSTITTWRCEIHRSVETKPCIGWFNRCVCVCKESPSLQCKTWIALFKEKINWSIPLDNDVGFSIWHDWHLNLNMIFLKFTIFKNQIQPSNFSPWRVKKTGTSPEVKQFATENWWLEELLSYWEGTFSGAMCARI